MTSEFELIQRYFARAPRRAVLGVGDDAALLRTTPGHELVVSTDMLVAGRHFLPNAQPCLLGQKALAVNLSDMAAMGAEPRWATLALALPSADEAWLADFARGVFMQADRFDVDLVGGDTTRGPLNICVHILGEVPEGQALRRDGAMPGDDIWVSGTLGEAAMGLAHLQGKIALAPDEAEHCLKRLHTPQPRVDLGVALRNIAHSAIDISDGLLADLGHILERSQAGAAIHFGSIPVWRAAARRLPEPVVVQCVLAGGDDYELCFTAATDRRAAIEALAPRLQLPLARIGSIMVEPALTVLDHTGRPMAIDARGYDHFA